MSLAVVCQGCGSTIRVADHLAGKRGKCPKCGQLVQIPAAEGGDTAAQVSPTTATIASSASPKPLKAKALPTATPQKAVDAARTESSTALPVVRPSGTSRPVADEELPVVAPSARDSTAAMAASSAVEEEIPTVAPAAIPTVAPARSGRTDQSGSNLGLGARSTESGSMIARRPSLAAAASGPPMFANATGSGVQIRSGESGTSSYVSKRRSSVAVPVWVWFVGGFGVLFSILGVVAYQSLVAPSPQQQVATPQPLPPRPGPQLNTTPLVGTTPSRPSNTPPQPPPGSTTTSGNPADAVSLPDTATLEDVIEFVEYGIVKIDTYDGWQRNGVGSGFLIDKSGLVATNYHVVSDCLKADVLFNDGVRFGVEGYRAVLPESDLAILQLNGVPDGVRALPLAFESSPRQGSPVYAIGHPHDYKFTVKDGIVSSLALTSELPDSSRSFLEEFLTDKIDHQWIQHSAQIAPGNSGGPLLNRRGEVLGVNTWVDREINSGFALHARHLHELRQKLSPQPEPLSKYRRSPEQLVQQQQPRVNVTPQLIHDLFEKLDQLNWHPGSESQFADFNQLAHLVTFVNYLRDGRQRVPGIDATQLKALSDEADDVADGLTQVTWDADKHVKAINTFAATGTFEPGSGAFLFGTVTKLHSGQPGQQLAELTITGTKERVLLIISGSNPLPVDTQLLLLGVCVAVARVGDNPLAQDELPLLFSKTIITLSEAPANPEKPADGANPAAPNAPAEPKSQP